MKCSRIALSFLLAMMAGTITALGPGESVRSMAADYRHRPHTSVCHATDLVASPAIIRPVSVVTPFDTTEPTVVQASRPEAFVPQAALTETVSPTVDAETYIDSYGHHYDPSWSGEREYETNMAYDRSAIPGPLDMNASQTDHYDVALYDDDDFVSDDGDLAMSEEIDAARDDRYASISSEVGYGAQTDLAQDDAEAAEASQDLAMAEDDDVEEMPDETPADSELADDVSTGREAAMDGWYGYEYRIPADLYGRDAMANDLARDEKPEFDYSDMPWNKGGAFQNNEAEATADTEAEAMVTEESTTDEQAYHGPTDGEGYGRDDIEYSAEAEDTDSSMADEWQRQDANGWLTDHEQAEIAAHEDETALEGEPGEEAAMGESADNDALAETEPSSMPQHYERAWALEKYGFCELMTGDAEESASADDDSDGDSDAMGEIERFGDEANSGWDMGDVSGVVPESTEGPMDAGIRAGVQWSSGMELFAEQPADLLTPPDIDLVQTLDEYRNQPLGVRRSAFNEFLEGQGADWVDFANQFEDATGTEVLGLADELPQLAAFLAAYRLYESGELGMGEATDLLRRSLDNLSVEWYDGVADIVQIRRDRSATYAAAAERDRTLESSAAERAFWQGTFQRAGQLWDRVERAFSEISKASARRPTDRQAGLDTWERDDTAANAIDPSGDRFQR